MIQHKWIYFALLIPSIVAAQASEVPVVQDIVRKLEALYRSTSSAGEIEMQIITPHWERSLRMQMWTEGTNKTFIRIMSPQKEKGITTLRIDNDMWNYLPNTNKVIKIPPSMMMSSWMGSDFTNDDLVNESSLADDYHHQLISPADAVADQLYVESIPREDLPIVWAKIVTAVRRSDYLPIWEKYYDEKGTLVRIINFRDITSFGDRIIPAVMELLPQNKPGQKTVIRYLKLEFNIKLDESIFSLRNLRS